MVIEYAGFLFAPEPKISHVFWLVKVSSYSTTSTAGFLPSEVFYCPPVDEEIFWYRYLSHHHSA